MEPAAAALVEFGIARGASAAPAHRIPESTLAYGRSVLAQGSRVIIAGTGGTTHLLGILAALTEFMVVGVPAPPKYLDGVDLLHSAVQTPVEVPVVTVSTAGAHSVGLFAARILSTGEESEAEALHAKMRNFQKGPCDLA